MSNVLEGLITPEMLDERKILSKTEQWKRRKRGELGFYRVGNKILYSPKHLQEFLARLEQKPASEQTREVDNDNI